MSRRRQALAQASAQKEGYVKRLLEGLRSWTLADDGTLRMRAERAERDGQGLVLDVAMANHMAAPGLGPVRAFWRNIPPNTVKWMAIDWPEADAWADYVGWPEPAWRSFKAECPACTWTRGSCPRLTSGR
jgi:hypothetical protein